MCGVVATAEIIPERECVVWLLEQFRRPELRTLREFAEEEIVVPTGPHAGEQFACDTQPFAGLLLDELDSGRWRKAVVVGPTQSGKTLVGNAIPTLHSLFERRETVIAGIPDMNMANDKWREDLEPVLSQTRYARFMPDRGDSSRGGGVKNAVRFRNGATLKYMSGGGGDAKRSGFTARVVIITEADKLDETGGSSREADKVSQLEARADAFGDDRLVIMESTVSHSRGRVWREYRAGTESRIACPCPHCKGWVTPERDHLVGWKEAETIADARSNAHWSCPACGEKITEAERIAMNRAAVLVHRGQRVEPDGKVSGEVPATDTLGFRWNAFNNLFWSAAYVAAAEWRARFDPDEENSEKALLQFKWAWPYDPPEADLSPLDAGRVARMVSDTPRGVVPRECEVVTVGCDLGLRVCHWAALAFSTDATVRVIDYGELEVPQVAEGPEHGIMMALDQLKDLCSSGWLRAGGDTRVRPGAVFIDAGYLPAPVYAFVRRSGVGYWATKGFGIGQLNGTYHAPRDGSQVGDGYHFAWQPTEAVWLVHVDADYWATWLHHRISAGSGAGRFALFAAGPRDHYLFARHLTAETRAAEFSAKTQAIVNVWRNPHKRPNHWFDACRLACAAAHGCGVRVIGEAPAPMTQARIAPVVEPIAGRGGRAFVATDR